MATYDEISRIAKILARATSPNEAEAINCIESAYKRMMRDGVKLEDLLTLPVQELYQASLNRLVDYIINLDTTMSPSEKRRLYAKQITIITLKFLEEEDTDTKQKYSYEKTKPNGGASTESPKSKTRAEEADDYYKRHGTNGSSSTAGQATDSGYSNSYTESTGYEDNEPPPKSRRPQKPAQAYKSYKFNLFGKTFSFSPAGFFDGFGDGVGEGRFWQHCFQNPFAAWNLIYCSLIFSLIASVGVLLLAGIIYAVIPFPVPNLSIATVFGFICAISFFVKLQHLYLAGWFE